MASELDNQNAVCNDNADHHDHAHQRHHVKGGVGGEKKQEHARKAWRNGEENDERVLPASKLSDENQVDQDNRQNEAHAEAAEGGAHALDGTAKLDTDSRRKRSCADIVIDFVGDRAQILGFGGNVDIHDPEELIVVDFGGGRNGFHFDDGVKESGLRTFHAPQRNLLEVRYGFDGVFGILHGEQVGIAAPGINPIIRCDHAVGSERGDDVVDDFFLGEAKEAGFFTIDVEFEGGVVDVLGNENVVDVFDLAYGLGKLGGGVVDTAEIVAADLNVDGRGKAEIDDRVHQAAGLEIGAELGELFA